MRKLNRSATSSAKARRGLKEHVRKYFTRHMQAALFSLGRQSRSLFANLMTIAVIGIALALPGGLYMALNHLAGVTQDLNESGAAISVFLQPDISLEQSEALQAKWTDWREIEYVDLIEKQQALEEFEQYSGFGHALNALEGNPLPNLLIVQPASHLTKPEDIRSLQLKLESLDETELVQVDLAWLQRFQAMTHIGQRAVLVLGVLLSLAVLLVIGNTIRLEVHNRRPEIEIMKLVGATDAFIRRPFLYTGLWYGLFGGLFAAILLSLAVFSLQRPILELARLYNANLPFSYPTPTLLGLITLSSCVLGLIGAWLAVGRHLSSIEPA